MSMVRANRAILPATLYWEDAVAAFMLRLDAREYSLHTRAAYGRALRQFEELMRWRQREVTGVSPRDVVTFIKHLQAQRDNSARSVQAKLSAVRSFYRFLVRERQVKANPAGRVRGPKVEKRLPDWLTCAQMDEMLRAASKQAEHGRLAELRDLTIIELLYGSGLRVAELVALDLEDVDLRERMVRVRQGKGDKERMVPLTGASADAIERYLPARYAFLRRRGHLRRARAALLIATHGGPSGSRLSVRSVQNRLKPLFIDATGNDSLSPHSLRHTCATHMLERARAAGKDALMAVKEMLGHEYLSSTAIYCHLSTSGMLDVFRRTHPRA